MNYRNILSSVLVTTVLLSTPFVGYATEDKDIKDALLLIEEDDKKQAPVVTPAYNDTPKKAIAYNKISEHGIDEYMNLSKLQFYIGLHGGGAATGTYGQLIGHDQTNYIGVGAHPVVGGIVGMAIQATPNFAFRLGLNAEHLFKMDRYILGVKKDNNGNYKINDKKQKIDKTSLLGEAYFDFRSGLWSAFFLKLAGGYSWINTDGVKESGITAGAGIGVRWYAHKYLTFDWTILDAKATFTKNISGDIGTQFGITFQY